MGLSTVFLMALSGFLGMATAGYFISIQPLLAAQAPELISAGYQTSLALFGIGAAELVPLRPLTHIAPEWA